MLSNHTELEERFIPFFFSGLVSIFRGLIFERDVMKHL